MTTLNVFYGKQRSGQLVLHVGGRMQFQYDAAWLQAGGSSLSLSLPLQEQAFEDSQARPFFANLLPESELRTLIARKLGLSEKNDFALLEAVGGECAGAIRLLPQDVSPSDQGSYRQLTSQALDELIQELPKRPMLAGEQGMRLSLAGAQNKLPVYFDGAQVSLPVGTQPSSHILKPPIPNYPDSVANEAFCMRLAQRIGLPVPQIQVLDRVQALYLVQRYDREVTSQGLQRIHQEDFCQALGIAPEQKYEKEGGPSLAQCVQLIRQHSVTPVADIQAMLRWIIFNVLIGNSDAHGKNIALLLNHPGPRLAPFYDLLCTAIYPGLSERFAMRIGGEDRPDWIGLRHWQRLGEDTGIHFRLIRQNLEGLKEQILTEATSLADEAPQPVPKKILGVIQSRRDKITRLLATSEQR